MVVFKTPTPPPKQAPIDEIPVENFPIESISRMFKQVNKITSLTIQFYIFFKCLYCLVPTGGTRRTGIN